MKSGLNMKEISIVFFGDSITEGQYIDTRHRWTSLVEKEICSAYEKKEVVIKCFNKGISGETTRQGLLRFSEDVQEKQPDILTIEFGLNDANHWVTDSGHPRVSPLAYEANLREMIDRARISGVKYILLSNNHRTLKKDILTGGSTLEKERKKYNDILRAVAYDKDVFFCDIDNWFDQIDKESYHKNLLESPDLLHLSELGHQHYAEKITPNIFKFIEEIFSNTEESNIYSSIKI